MIHKLIALITVLSGCYCLPAGVWVFCVPQDAATSGYDASVGVKAVVLGLALVAIGAVAMAGARRIE